MIASKRDIQGLQVDLAQERPTNFATNPSEVGLYKSV